MDFCMSILFRCFLTWSPSTNGSKFSHGFQDLVFLKVCLTHQDWGEEGTKYLICFHVTSFPYPFSSRPTFSLVFLTCRNSCCPSCPSPDTSPGGDTIPAYLDCVSVSCFSLIWGCWTMSAVELSQFWFCKILILVTLCWFLLAEHSDHSCYNHVRYWLVCALIC